LDDTVKITANYVGVCFWGNYYFDECNRSKSKM